MRVFALMSWILISVSGFAAELVPMATQEGLERLARSKYKTDFAKLSVHYLNQRDRITCGPTTGAIVLNALRYGTDKAPLVAVNSDFLKQMPTGKDGKRFDPQLRMYTAENFFNPKALSLKPLADIYARPKKDPANPQKESRDPGYQLAQFRRVLEEAHGVHVAQVTVGLKDVPLAERDAAQIVKEMKKNLSEADNYVIVNYARGVLKQNGSGHISPVAAYDEESNSFLILDVNPMAGPWVWVDASDLLNAMATHDTVENRGLLFVSEK